MKDNRDGASGNNRFDAVEIDSRLGLIKTVRGPDRRRKTVNAGRFDKFNAPLDWKLKMRTFGFFLVDAGCRFAGRITSVLTYKQIFVTLEQVTVYSSGSWGRTDLTVVVLQLLRYREH
ncbi:MAG: hypothetical protein WB586_28145 [Chthoniobacterales bacterium]